MFRTIDPRHTATRDLHQYMVGTVGPRPIAFVSTLDTEGRANVAPYSFFNAFSSNPPIVVFSSNRRVRDNTTKDTLANIEATRECVINVVDHAILHQMAVASVEWPHEVSEFDAAGLTPLASDTVKAFRVKESPAHLECKVREVVTLGEEGGAGHLIICDVWRLHVAERVIDERDRIDPHELDLMGRLGRSFYVRASGDAVFPVVQPVLGPAIGFQVLPAHVRDSEVLTGNDLGRLAGAPSLPEAASIEQLASSDERVRAALASEEPTRALHTYAKELLAAGHVEDALRTVLVSVE